MRNFLFIAIALFFLCTNDLIGQNSVQLNDIEIVNLGDGQVFGHKRDSEKTAINGKVRIITGYTTEYIDAEFANGLAIGKWEYYKNNNLARVTNYENGYENGERITYHHDGKTISTKTPLLKGKVNGVATRYNQDGKKEYEKSMKNGEDDGPERSFDENGEITSETIFKNGKAEGKAFATYNKKQSDCYTKTEFYKNGQLDGEYLEKYCDGETKTKGKYIAGKKDARWEYYKADGSRRKPTEEYQNGDLIKKITYYTNGNIETERNYKNGKEDGTTKQFTQDGELKSEKNYVNGKQVGRQMQHYTSSANNYIEISNYSTDGKKDGEYSENYTETKTLKTKGQYLKGQKHGKWITSDISGNLVKEEEYNNGKITGSKRTEKFKIAPQPAYTSTTLYDASGNKTGEYTEIFDDNKKIRKKGTYVNGRQNGKWLFYDKSGKLTKEEVYENGKQISSQQF